MNLSMIPPCRLAAVVTRARVDGVLLTLERGALSSSVETGSPYSVLAPPYTFEVRGTRFSVARRTDGAVSVTGMEVAPGDVILRVRVPPTRSSVGVAIGL